MDNFMDKLAQKFSAQEMIKANSQAEAAELKRLQLQVAEYEKILQEMRKLNYKNAELSDKIDLLVGENAQKLEGLQSEEQKLLALLRSLTEEQTRNREEELSGKEQAKQDAIALQQEQTQQLFDAIEEHRKELEDFSHKENVKVYRNVQAVVVEELKQQTQQLTEELQRMSSKVNVVMVFGIFTMLLAAVGIVLQILTGLNIKLF